MSTPEHLFALRRSIKVMSYGQVAGREEKNRFKRGYNRLRPSSHLVASEEFLDLALQAYSGKKVNGLRWQKFVDPNFEDRRDEYRAEHESRMRSFDRTDTQMGAIIRAHHLAYAFLRHKPYRSVEAKAYEAPALDIIYQVIVQNHPDQNFPSEARKALADWLLDLGGTEVPEGDWQFSGHSRYKLRNISEGKHPMEGLPKFEQEKERRKAQQLAAARAATGGETVN